MSHKSSKAPEFCLEGRFLNFILKDGYKIRALRLVTPSGEYLIKLKKSARASLGYTLTPGEWIQVAGYQKLDEKDGTVEFKAYRIERIAPRSGQVLEEIQPLHQPTAAPTAAKPATILVCQKSDCCKRGGRAVTEALERELSDRHLTDQVKVRGTGCMKRCKTGPHIVMPDKTRYSQIRPSEIAAVVEKHLGQLEPVPAIAQ